MRIASSLYRHIHGRYASIDSDLVRFYEELHLNTYAERQNQRHQRAADALEDHRQTEIPNIGNGFVSERDSLWLPLIKKHIPDCVKRYAYRFGLEDDLLAAGLYCLTTNCFKQNRPDRMHTCTDGALEAFYSKLKRDGALVGPKGKKIATSRKNKRLGVLKALQMGGLIVLRDSSFHYGGRVHGRGQKFGIGENHPRHDEFEKLYGHLVDPKCFSLKSKTEKAVDETKKGDEYAFSNNNEIADCSAA